LIEIELVMFFENRIVTQTGKRMCKCNLTSAYLNLCHPFSTFHHMLPKLGRLKLGLMLS